MSPRGRPIRVLVAEDSTTVRQLLVELLRGDPAFEVVAEAANGAEAVAHAIALRPDLITMDVHMPIVDGLDATKEIMREAPTPILVVTAAAATDVGLGLSATQAGALMVVPKPEHPRSPDFERHCQHFLAMARAMAEVKVVRQWRGARAPHPGPPRREPPARRRAGPVQAVAIGTSTGGPAALRRVLIDLPRDLRVPVLVVQHIARGFVDGLVAWLGANVPLRVAVAGDGEPLQPGVVYLAPDDRHLAAVADGATPAGARARLLDGAPVGGFRPSADVLFEGCARAWGAGVLALVLTGMGRDGVDGLQAVRRAGGRVLAQDEGSSVVYGMAQEAVGAGLVDEVLPLDAIGRRVVELIADPE